MSEQNPPVSPEKPDPNNKQPDKKTEPQKPATPPPAKPVTPAAVPPSTGGSKEPPKTAPPAQPVVPAAASPAAAPAKPAAAPQSPARRQFMVSWLALAWTAFAAATIAALSTCLRFLYPNVLFEPKMKFKIGKPEEYEIGQVDTRWKEAYAIWVVRTVEGMYALSTVCTHLGCTPSWLPNEQKFKCPCHGSGFYKSGINFEGPAPRPLERFEIGLADDGQVYVDKSKKFQQEKGEWDNPGSLLKL